MYRTLSELGLTEKDFKFEIIELGSPKYDSYTFCHPERELIAKVNGVIVKVRTRINIELANDIRAFSGCDFSEGIDKILKLEAINYYINNNQYIRREKLRKIEKNKKIGKIKKL